MHKPAQPIRLISVKDAMARRGRKSSQHYEDIKDGTCPPPIKIGERGSRHVEHEIDLIVCAEIAGQSREQIKGLVADLVATRKSLAEPALEAA